MSEVAEPILKKQKVNGTEDDAAAKKECQNGSTVHEFKSFNNFEIEEILHNNHDRFSIALKGKFKDKDGFAVAHLQVSLSILILFNLICLEYLSIYQNIKLNTSLHNNYY